MTMTKEQEKCPYCDFQGKDQIGIEVNSGKRLTEDQMIHSEWGDGCYYIYLKKEDANTFLLVILETDDEGWSYHYSDANIDHCPYCGKKLKDD